MLDYDEYSKVFGNIRKKWEEAEKFVIDCNPKAVNSISEVDILLERHKEFQFGKEWRVLTKDQEIIKKDFTTNCICQKKK